MCTPYLSRWELGGINEMVCVECSEPLANTIIRTAKQNIASGNLGVTSR